MLTGERARIREIPRANCIDLVTRSVTVAPLFCGPRNVREGREIDHNVQLRFGNSRHGGFAVSDVNAERSEHAIRGNLSNPCTYHPRETRCCNINWCFTAFRRGHYVHNTGESQACQATSQILRRPSCPPAASRCPSGDQATDVRHVGTAMVVCNGSRTSEADQIRSVRSLATAVSYTHL